MFYGAIVLFVLAALGGLTMLVMHLRGKTPPYALVILHGLLAAAGLVVLILALLPAGFGGLPAYALAIFILAALGGFALLSFQLRGKPLPTAFVFVHGIIAVIAFVILLASVLK